jgi:uncharacterized protein
VNMIKMSENLPFFKYHPNPIETGNVIASEDICLCCNQKRGYIYQSSIYTPQDLDGSVCPWCIANGSAAKKFEATFSDDYILVESGISDDIIEEVTKRTPSYISWQQEVWLIHCKDVCEFHGDAEEKETKNLDTDTIRTFCFENEIKDEVGDLTLKNYQKGGNPAIYKFVCRHCNEVKLYFDCT